LALKEPYVNNPRPTAGGRNYSMPGCSEGAQQEQKGSIKIGCSVRHTDKQKDQPEATFAQSPNRVNIQK